MAAGVDSYGEVAAGLALNVRRTGQQASGEVRERAAMRPSMCPYGPEVDAFARGATLPAFDKRPGTLEATRLDQAPVAVAGKKDGGRWMVLAIIGGFEVTMPPAAAIALAEQLVTYAELAAQGRAA